MSNLKDFEAVLSIFEEISKIPRCSKNEEKIAAYLENFGKSRGFETKRDSHNNILIQVPATAGFENLPAVVLQSHMDMVCEKENGSTHNFSKDALSLNYIEENGISYLTAEKTTLGADNGIGMAYALAIAASNDLCHPPLELLFTTDEEIGLTGAQGMENDFISGEYMINLDSEEEGIIIVGCAGGTQICFKQFIDVKNLLSEDEIKNPNLTISLYSISVSGLKGGHSGTDIHIGRGNANKIAARFFNKLNEKYLENRIELIEIKGGSASNTIPRYAEILIATDISSENLKNEAAELKRIILSDSAFNDSDLTIEVEENSSSIEMVSLKSFSQKGAAQMIRFLAAVPTGVFEMSPDIEGLVLVSGNLAIVKTKTESETSEILGENSKKEIEIIYSLRSGNESKLKEKIKEMMDIAAENRFIAEISHTYLPWEPRFESDFLKKCANVYKETFGKEASVEAIHAGLECGVFHRTFPKMQMISIGPDISGAHTPDEKLNLDAAEKVWIYLKEILKAF